MEQAIDHTFEYSAVTDASVLFMLDLVASGVSMYCPADSFDLSSDAATDACVDDVVDGLEMLEMTSADDAIEDDSSKMPDLLPVADVESDDSTMPVLDAWAAGDADVFGGIHFELFSPLLDGANEDLCEIDLVECEDTLAVVELENSVLDLCTTDNFHVSAFSFCEWCGSFGHLEIDHVLYFIKE